MDTTSPDIVLPEHIEKEIHGTAPPSYEEVMGGQTLSTVQTNSSDLSPLAYVDIMPACLSVGDMANRIRPQFELFGCLVEKCNHWLRENPLYAAWKCEPVERKFEKNGNVDLNVMLERESTFGFNVYVTGLRIWLIKNVDSRNEPQQLGHVSFTPQETSVSLPMSMVGGLMVPSHHIPANLRMVTNQGMVGPQYELKTLAGMGDTIRHINQAIQSQPIQGRILNIDTATIKMTENLSQIDLDTNRTCRHESGDSMIKRRSKVFRIFYTKGQPETGEIGTEVFTPEILRGPYQGKKALYGKFSEVVQRTRDWLKEQTGIRVVGISSEPLKARENYFAGTAEYDIENLDEWDIRIGSEKQVRAIRIFYVTDTSSKVTYNNVELTSRLFVPVRLNSRTFESMYQTMFRLEAWLRVTRLDIFDVETVRYFYRNGSKLYINEEDSDQDIIANSSRQWLRAIRVYFPRIVHEPPVDLLPGLPDLPTESDGSNSCAIV